MYAKISTINTYVRFAYKFETAFKSALQAKISPCITAETPCSL